MSIGAGSCCIGWDISHCPTSFLPSSLKPINSVSQCIAHDMDRTDKFGSNGHGVIGDDYGEDVGLGLP